MQICYSKNEKKEEIKYTTKPVFLPSRFVVEATLQIIFLKAWVFLREKLLTTRNYAELSITYEQLLELYNRIHSEFLLSFHHLFRWLKYKHIS